MLPALLLTLSLSQTSVPQDQHAPFLGTATCGSSTCHDSPKPWRNATVTMREFWLWQTRDPHARSLETLQSDAARAITNQLGLAEPSHEPACLTCHEGRQIAEKSESGDATAIGCETCHGPGKAFLATHVGTRSTHAGNLAAGMYPTTNAEARATLCASCHVGDATRRLSHIMYAAGHPRLRFEMHSWSGAWPYHAIEDRDYRRRKPIPDRSTMWFAGQLANTESLLTRLADPSAHRGLFPELSLFDCHSCHRSLHAKSSLVRQSLGLPPGSVSLDSASMILIGAALKPADPALASRWHTYERDLNQAMANRGDTTALVAEGQRLITETRTAVSAGKLVANTEPACLLRALLDEAKRQQPLPRPSAEAYTMTLASMLIGPNASLVVDPEHLISVQADVDALYQANDPTESADEALRAAKVDATLQHLASSLPACSS
ncbi:hypothetical protein C7S18_02730 [Ahniella affigens]|uniref:Cytochrome c-552/4 domain-containing protein n=1 Tax=Ahniella affigens TaxID=2021234 RepID=A0A2P1PMW2_9GAMM|nr:multiheme c-type cytochrome [Ahniella affigens]AVP96175.1 hypothetical protein C7S18_02730 [Ahniella affigens]